MRAEEYAVFGNFPEVVQAEDLEASGIRQNGARPSHEAMQAAQALNTLVPWPEKQVIGVGENDPGIEIVLEIARGKRFHGRLGTHRHEDRRLDGAVRRMQETGASARFGTRGLYFESEPGHPGLFLRIEKSLACARGSERPRNERYEALLDEPAAREAERQNTEGGGY